MKKIILTVASVITLSSCTQNKIKDTLDYKRIPMISNSMISSGEISSSNKAVSKTVYVSIYSNLLNYDTDEQIALQSHVSIRNIDPEETVTLSSAVYYDINGKKIRDLISQPLSIGALATQELVIKTSDLEGGSGAKILLDWHSESILIKHPLIEVLTTDLSKKHGISFLNKGVTLD